MATRVICKNHGVIQEIPDAMWVNGPPIPYAFCPHCGSPTVVEPIPQGSGFWSSTEEERRAAKQHEIDYYRNKYWPEDYGEKIDAVAAALERRKFKKR
jgi:hypothetical protein